jgi:hypothetical protein
LWSLWWFSREKNAEDTITTPRAKIEDIMLGRDLTLETETCVFILLSTLDLFLTVFLMEHFPVGEANPLAEYVLANWHYRGLVVFKFSVVAAVCVLAQIIALHKERTGRAVMVGGCLLMAALVGYSVRLALRVML